MTFANTSEAKSSSTYRSGVQLNLYPHHANPPFGWFRYNGPFPREPIDLDDDADRIAFALEHPPAFTPPPRSQKPLHRFTITGEKTLRRRGPRVFTGKLDDTPGSFIGKIYDYFDYPLSDCGFDFVLQADMDYCVERKAYEMITEVTETRRLVPEFFGGFAFPLDTSIPGRQRWVCMILLEEVPGETMLAKINQAIEGDEPLPSLSDRLRVLQHAIEAEIELWWTAEVRQDDFEPCNIMIRKNGGVTILDFNRVTLYPFEPHLENLKHKYEGQTLPTSPILIDAVKALVVPFVREADDALPSRRAGTLVPDSHGTVKNTLVDARAPEDLVRELALSLPEGEGLGKDGLLELISKVLKYSVNTWDQGFLDKLYASNTPVGLVSDMLLGALNTNSHVYQVSPALTVIEKHTARSLARLFGFNGPRAGGFTCQGGSGSNLTSLVVARNTLYPECKLGGNVAAPSPFVLFTSAHGHYSVEKAANICGMGSSAVWTVPVDTEGRMDPAALRSLVKRARAEGRTPLYVNATAGTTVLGSYDPIEEISAVCREFGLWLHVDASWGGPAIFSRRHRHKLAGAHLADSLTVNPHKMMNVPVTCSFLLGPDTAIFHRANTLPAGYLFHGPAEPEAKNSTNGCEATPSTIAFDAPEAPEVWDLADLTLQCGRRADSLKLALAWVYYGSAGFERQVDGAFEVAAHMAALVADHPDLELVSSNPPPCLQVCFYYAPGGKVAEDVAVNTRRTRTIVQKLVGKGYMVDYAPGEKGSFFRVVVNCQTLKGTVEGLVKAIGEVGKEVVGEEA
ncbi:hypothetical protein VTJ49DRAFT_2672 [Mycothermus thermophilus]|uniref:Uncharacterized protein n=1 Tax=Humicola insolens TaxID=85995 RepID=A0ABR3V9X4_HUMIN